MATISSEEILAACRALGFADAGIAPVRPTRWAGELTAWLAGGKHGQMAYMSEQVAERLDPQLVLPGARFAIMVADLYARRGEDDTPAGPGRGRIARYARGRDYHQVLRKRLHRLADRLRKRYPGTKTRTFVDTAPVLEREFAAAAGLGWVAKNTMVIHPRLGSYVLLGGIFTTLEIEGVTPAAPVPDHCGTCTRCIDACPTGAITPYSVDGSRCISYLTIEHRDVIDPALHGAIGQWVYGCDVCQEVCPHNSARDDGKYVGTVFPAYESRRDSLDLLEVLGWDAGSRQGSFMTSPMKRATLGMMKRNALIAAGNAIARGIALPGDDDGGCASGLEHRAEAQCHGELLTALVGRVRTIAADESELELVRRTARQVLDRLGG